MHTVTATLAWSFWVRHRLEAALSVIYLCAVLLIVSLSEPGALTPNVVGQLSIPLWFVLPYLIGAFSYGADASFDAAESGYPRRLFTLPVSTPALVACPLVLGGAALILFWYIVAGLILRAGGVPAPLLWVALFLVALLAWSQALTWWPFPLPFLRIGVALVVLSGLTTLAVFGFLYEVAPTWLSIAAALLTAAGYLAAVRGVSRARCGDVPRLEWRRQASALPAAAAPFETPAQAQFWLEWRRHGFILPLMVGVILLPELVLLACASEVRMREFQAVVFLISQYVLLPLFGGWVGTALGNCYPSSRKITAIPPFLAARPLSDADMLAAKLRTALGTTLITLLMAAAMMAILLPLAPAGQVLLGWARALIEAEGARGVLLVLLLLAAWPLVLIKAVLSYLWIGLSGREWISVLVALVVPVVVVAPGLTIWWLDPNPTARGQLLLRALPWVVGAAVLLKVAAGACVLSLLDRRRLVARRTLVALALAWLSAAAIIVALTLWLLPEFEMRWVAAGGAILLLLPLVRLGLAPLMLAWNRHR